MKFERGESVIILDTENKPAGTGDVISSDEGGLYKIAFTYFGTDKKEELILPEHRLLTNKGIPDQELKISDQL
jgi:hypothetical protein